MRLRILEAGVNQLEDLRAQRLDLLQAEGHEFGALHLSVDPLGPIS